MELPNSGASKKRCRGTYYRALSRLLFLGRADSSFPPDKFALWEVSRPPSLQLAVSPDQMVHFRSQFATCYLVGTCSGFIPNGAKLIHSDVRKPPRFDSTSAHPSIEAASQISSFCGEPIDSKPRSAVHRRLASDLQAGRLGAPRIGSLSAAVAFGRAAPEVCQRWTLVGS